MATPLVKNPFKNPTPLPFRSRNSALGGRRTSVLPFTTPHGSTLRLSTPTSKLLATGLVYCAGNETQCSTGFGVGLYACWHCVAGFRFQVIDIPRSFASFTTSRSVKKILRAAASESLPWSTTTTWSRQWRSHTRLIGLFDEFDARYSLMVYCSDVKK